MNSSLLILLVIFYLGLLFFVAYLAENSRKKFWTNNPYIYSLSLAVYCTAWTYYGSIGVAAESGLEFLTIYIGPIIVIPLWVLINKKIIKISRVNKISSIADFIALRYGNRRSLGAIVTILCLLAIIPYIALQIKAVSETFHLLSETDHSTNIFIDTSTYVVIIIAGFSSFYGTKYVDASEKRMGIISAVAVESFLKLIFFLILGVFIVYGIFNGFDDIYSQASKLPDFEKLNTFQGLDASANWFVMCLLSASAIFLLPRQFHTTIIENRNEKHIHTAIWLFPLYLLLINIFVFPIAWGGKILFEGQNVNPEFFSILIPQKFGNAIISTMVFFGGLSACISMIIVSSITLSVMLSNNIIIPYGWLERFKIKNEVDNTKTIVNIRKFGIFTLIIIAFVFYKYFMIQSSLFSIGLISFVIIAQLGPSFFGAIFWKRGTYFGAISGIIAGVLICYINLVFPHYYPNINEYKIFKFFRIPYFNEISNVFFWSITVNMLCYLVFSVNKIGDYRERNYAEIYTDIEEYIQNHENAYIWKGSAKISDIKKILNRFLGDRKTEQALKIFNAKYSLNEKNDLADARFIKFSENLLSGRIGTSSAKILIESVTQEDKISLPEVLQILEESKENISLNKKLQEQSQKLQLLTSQLQEANDNLIFKDQQKDEFLDTVAHELRTPITAIRATSEIILDDDEMPQDIKEEFLQNIISESDRLAEIINDILYLDKLENKSLPINLNQSDIHQTYIKATKPLQNLFEQKNIQHQIINHLNNHEIPIDESKMIQVFQNIVGNAIKFSEQNGIIETTISENQHQTIIQIFNTGKNIDAEDLKFIFDKFYQSKNQNILKPLGSGLGLAICKKIIDAHEGQIEAINKDSGVEFILKLNKM